MEFDMIFPIQFSDLTKQFNIESNSIETLKKKIAFSQINILFSQIVKTFFYAKIDLKLINLSEETIKKFPEYIYVIAQRTALIYYMQYPLTQKIKPRNYITVIDVERTTLFYAHDAHQRYFDSNN